MNSKAIIMLPRNIKNLGSLCSRGDCSIFTRLHFCTCYAKRIP